MLSVETRRWRSSLSVTFAELCGAGAGSKWREKGRSSSSRVSVTRDAAPPVATALPPLPQRVARVLRAPGAAATSWQGARLLPASTSVPWRATSTPATTSTPEPTPSSPPGTPRVCVSLPTPCPLALPRPRGPGAQWWREWPLPESSAATPTPPRQGEPPQATLHGEPAGHEAAPPPRAQTCTYAFLHFLLVCLFVCGNVIYSTVPSTGAYTGWVLNVPLPHHHSSLILVKLFDKKFLPGMLYETRNLVLVFRRISPFAFFSLSFLCNYLSLNKGVR